MVEKKEKPTFTFWYHVNKDAHLRQKYIFDPERMNDALEKALKQRQEEIISQLEDWNNKEGYNLNEAIEKLKEELK